MAVTSMKAITLFAVATTCMAAVLSEESKDRTITQVVKLLKNMLDKSVKEGDEEATVYAKFKCYCDQNEAEKTKSIKLLTGQIDELKASIEEIQGDTGGLSSECAELKKAMGKNKDAQKDAERLRDKDNEAYKKSQAELKVAIEQMEEALEILGKVGGDQTKSEGADHKQFMAGKDKDYKKDRAWQVDPASLLTLQQALGTASDLMTDKKHVQVTTAFLQSTKSAAFLQAPFTGTYTSQSAQVVGIIKSMRDTFIQNHHDGEATEEKQLREFTDYMANKEEAHEEMHESYVAKQKSLGSNDEDLADDKDTLDKSEEQKAQDEKFLREMAPMCEKKAADFANRKMLRANEESAIAEAVSILNSDEAFATFGNVKATKTGAKSQEEGSFELAASFTQLRSVRAHVASNLNTQVQTVLESAAKDAHSGRLSKVAALLQAGNPFDAVIKEIIKMKDVIHEEQHTDDEKLEFCIKEENANEAAHKSNERQMDSLDEAIAKLDELIEGLKKNIAQTEDDLTQNKANQEKATAQRTKEKATYQRDVKNLVQASGILNKAIKALKTYYGDLEAKLAAGEAFLQEKPKEGYKAPKPGDQFDAYQGQSSKGGDVIDMLTFISDETTKEHTSADTKEHDAVELYDELMAGLTKDQKADEGRLAGLQENLADSEKDLLDDHEEHKDTAAEIDAIEDYMKKLKPGCDFIMDNHKDRTEKRGLERQALEKAVELIKGSPAYGSWTMCKVECGEHDDTAECKACQAEMSVKDYCAGRKDTKGCPTK